MIVGVSKVKESPIENLGASEEKLGSLIKNLGFTRALPPVGCFRKEAFSKVLQ